MLLALRSLYETAEVVEIPRGGKKYRKSRGVPPLTPPFRAEVTAFIIGSEVRCEQGKIKATGGSSVTVSSSEFLFELGQPIIQAGGLARIFGSEMHIETGHDVEPASVILGARELEQLDDDEALAIILGQ